MLIEDTVSANVTSGTENMMPISRVSHRNFLKFNKNKKLSKKKTCNKVKCENDVSELNIIKSKLKNESFILLQSYETNEIIFVKKGDIV